MVIQYKWILDLNKKSCVTPHEKLIEIESTPSSPLA